MGATPYFFRSGFNAGIAFAQDVRAKDYPRELLKRGLRKGNACANITWEISIRYSRWALIARLVRDAVSRPEANDGMVVAFRRDQSLTALASASFARSIRPRTTR